MKQCFKIFCMLITMVLAGIGCQSLNEQVLRSEPLSFHCEATSEHKNGKLLNSITIQPEIALSTVDGEETNDEALPPGIPVTISSDMSSEQPGACGIILNDQNKKVYGCWHKDGSLNIYWPHVVPADNSQVSVKRRRLFGLMENAAHRFECRKHYGELLTTGTL